jgi:hypothetical protein
MSRSRTSYSDDNQNYAIDTLEGITILGDAFDSSRLIKLYQNSNEPSSRERTLVDLSDVLANMGAAIQFDFLGSQSAAGYVALKAFITAYNETFSCDWEMESVYGRIDPIPMFKQTTRNVTLAIAIPSATTSEGYENLAKVDKLRSMLYPTYDTNDNALSITQSPVTRINILSLLSGGPKQIGNNLSPIPKRKYTSFFGDALSFAGNQAGALCIIQNLSITHNIENPSVGVFVSGKRQQAAAGSATGADSESSIRADHSFIIPKLIEVSLDLTVIHEGMMGHIADEETSQQNGENFVYRIGHEASLADAERERAQALAQAQRATGADQDRTEGAAQQAAQDAQVAQWRTASQQRRTLRKDADYSRRQSRQIQKAGLYDEAIYFENNILSYDMTDDDEAFRQDYYETGLAEILEN